MTTGEAIRRVDELKPNAYTDQMKISWLSELDGKIFEEVILTHIDEHIPPPGIFYPHDAPEMEVEVFSEYSTLEDELIVPFPYAGDVYTFYLMSQIDLHNAETAKYNQSITLYNAAYQTYFDWYNRTHKPIRKGRRIRF